LFPGLDAILNPGNKERAPNEARYSTDHYFPNCFVSAEQMTAYKELRTQKFGIGASSTHLAEALERKIGIKLQPAVSTDQPIKLGLIYTDPVPKRAYFIGSENECVLQRRTAFGTSVKDDAVFLYCVKPQPSLFKLELDENGFTQVVPTEKYTEAMLNTSDFGSLRDPFWRDTAPHHNAVSLQMMHNVGPSSSVHFFDPVKAIDNCKRSAHCQGGNACFMDRLLIAVKNKGSFQYLYPYTRAEADRAMERSGIPYGTFWSVGKQIAEQYTTKAALVRVEGDQGTVIKVNRDASMGLPWGVRLNASTPAEERALSMAHYMSNSLKWSVNPSSEYIDLLNSRPSLALMAAKTKSEVMEVKKFAEGRARFLLMIPQHLKYLLQTTVQPFESAKMTMADAILHYPEDYWKLRSAQKLSLSKSGKNLIIQNLDVQLKRKPLAFVTAGDDCLFAVLCLDDLGSDPLPRFHIGQLDLTSYDLHQSEAQDEVVWDALVAKLSNVDAGLAELTKTIRTRNKIVLKGMGVVQMTGIGTSGFPLQSTANHVLMNALLGRCEDAIDKFGTVLVRGRTVYNCTLKQIDAICTEEARKAGQEIKAIWESVSITKEAPRPMSLAEEDRLKSENHCRFWEEGNIILANRAPDVSVANMELAKRSLMLADDRLERESFVLYAMAREGLKAKFLGFNFLVTQLAELPCLFDLMPPIDLRNQLVFQRDLYTGSWNEEQLYDAVLDHL